MEGRVSEHPAPVGKLVEKKARLLAFVSEHHLPFSIVPDLIFIFIDLAATINLLITLPHYGGCVEAEKTMIERERPR